MKVKIFKAFPAYSTYLDIFYGANPKAGSLSFEDQLDLLTQDFFPWVLSWSQFNHDDEVEVFETIHNAAPLQQAWAGHMYENDIDWQKIIVLKQIESIQPHVCVIYPPELFTPDFVDQVRSVVHHEVVIGGYDGMNRQKIELYKGYDFVVTCSKYISAYYHKNNKATYPLEFAFDSRINDRIVIRPKRYPVSFSGSMMEGVHNDRVELLKYLVMHTSIVVGSDFEVNRHYSLLSRRLLRSIKRNQFQDFFSLYLIHKRNIGPQYGLKMFQFLSDSAISLNLHGDKITFAANVRLYESTGVGSCLLTDWKENIGDIFEPDKEIVTFCSKEEASDKIHYLLKHEKERQKIALNGQKRTLSEYTYDKRITGVIDYIKKMI